MTVDDITRRHSDRRLAVTAQGLYLLNLLFPLIPLVFLLAIYFRRVADAGALGRNHLRQALPAALVSSVLFVLANGVVLAYGGYRSVVALITFEVYFIAVVPLFVIPGLMGLLRAMNEQEFRFPILGRFVRGDR
jgi:uncharacterized Tic20 family protein